MNNGDYSSAVTLFLDILDIMTDHFVKDRYYLFFDDYYSPDDVCQSILRSMNVKIRLVFSRNPSWND